MEPANCVFNPHIFQSEAREPAAGARMRVHCNRFSLTILAAAISLTLACTRNLMTRAQELELSGNNVSALQLYQRALVQAPASGRQRAAILMRIGDCLYRLDRSEEAFTTYKKATEADPQNLDARLRMGDMLLTAGAPEAAREQATAVLEKSPENTEGLALEGAAAAGSGDFDHARQFYLRALKNDPRRTSVAIALADIYSREGKTEQARALLKQTTVTDPQNTLPWLALGRLEEQEGNPQAAEVAYRKAISIDNTPATNLLFTQFLQRSSRIAEAEQALRTVDAERRSLPVALGDFRLSSGHPNEAIEQYETACYSIQAPSTPRLRWNPLSPSGSSKPKVSPDDREGIASRLIEAQIAAVSRLDANQRKKAIPAIWSRLLASPIDSAAQEVLQVELALADENLSLAKQYADIATQLAIASAPAHYVAGMVASESGDRDTAETEWQNALDQDSHFLPARLALAQAALMQGDPEDADQQARTAVRQDPGNIHATVLFARALLQENKMVPAAIMAQRAAALDSASPEPALILGEVALRVNNPAQALMYFEKALTADPDSQAAIDGLLHVYQLGHLSYAAIGNLERVAQAPPASATLLEIAGRLYAERGWYTDAIRALQRTVQFDPKRLTAARALARLQASTGDYLAASQSAIRAGVDARALLSAYQQQNTGNWHQAAADYEQALHQGDQSGVAANNLAWIYAEHGLELDRALALAEMAVQQSPDSPSMLDTLGFVHLQRREYSQAVKLLETAQRLTDNISPELDKQRLRAEIRKHLSTAYMCAGQTEAALRLAQKRSPF